MGGQTVELGAYNDMQIADCGMRRAERAAVCLHPLVSAEQGDEYTTGFNSSWNSSVLLDGKVYALAENNHLYNPRLVLLEWQIEQSLEPGRTTCSARGVKVPAYVSLNV